MSLEDDSVILELEDKANAFISTCQKYYEFTLATQQQSSLGPKMATSNSKRRIKPTLITSFGLLSIREDMKQAADTSKNAEITGSNPRNNDWIEQWTRIIRDCSNDCRDSNAPVTLRLLSVMVKVLPASQTLLGCDPGALAGEFAPIMGLLSAFIPLFQRHLALLFQLAPSLSRTLNANSLVRILRVQEPTVATSGVTESIESRNSLHISNGSSDDLDAVPLAYDDRRDSRGRHSILHANQQKIRDLLHAWIRGLVRWRPTQAAVAAFELVAGVHESNFGWFAGLLLSEYEQLERGAQRGSRLERLEERLTSKTGNLQTTENAMIHLVRSVDSLKLTTALQTTLFELIEDEILPPLIDASRRTDFGIVVLRLISLGRLLAACAGRITGQYDDPVLCFLRDLLIDAYEQRYLVAVLPLAASVLKGAPQLGNGLFPLVSTIRKISKDQGRATCIDVAIGVLINSMLYAMGLKGDGKEEQYYLLEKPGNDVAALDDDMQISSSLELILSTVSGEFKVWLLELGNINVASSNAAIFAPSSATAAPPTAKAPRKIRPVTAAPEEAIVQKKLRQWFWWQYPAFREVTQVLIKYLQHEVHTLQSAARLLWSVIPKLMPESLKESPRMQNIVICLLLESFDMDGSTDDDSNSYDSR